MIYLGSTQIGYVRLEGVDLLPAQLQELTFKITCAQEQTDGIGKRWAEFHPTGRRALTVTQSGAYFTADVDGIHGAMIAWPPAPRRFELALGDQAGDPVLVAEGTFVASYEVLARNGNLTRANVTYTISGAVAWETIPPARAAA